MRRQWKQWQTLFSWAPKSLQIVTAAMKLKNAPWKKSYDQHRQPFKKQRHHFANKGPSSQSCGFSSSHVWMWKLDHKEGWMLKNWWFIIVVLEKTLESLGQQGDQTNLSYRKSNPNIHQKDWCWCSNTLTTWCKEPTHGKDPDAGKDWGQEEKGATENEMLDGIMTQWTWVWANS